MTKTIKRKGIAMAVALTFMAALMISSVPQMHSAITNSRASQRVLNTEKAFWLAEAGIHEARYAIANDTLNAANGWDQSGNRYTLDVDHGEDNYTVTVTVTGNDYAISSNGAIKGFGVNQAFTKNLTLDATAASSTSSTVFEYAARADGDISVLYGGSINGDIAMGGDLNCPSSGTINGDVSVVSSSNLSNAGGASISTTPSTGFINEALPEVQLPSGFPTPTISHYYDGPWGFTKTVGPGKVSCTGIYTNAGASFRLRNNTELYVDGDIDIVGQSDLRVISGSATIYVTGDIFTYNSGSLNSNSSAKLLVIAIGDENQKIEIEGNSRASNVAIYAPKASVEVANSAGVNGSVVANNITISGGAGITYDSSVSGTTVSTGTTTSTLSFSNWNES